MSKTESVNVKKVKNETGSKKTVRGGYRTKHANGGGGKKNSGDIEILLLETLPELSDGKVHKTFDLVNMGTVRYLEKDYQGCVRKGRAKIKREGEASQYTIPEIATYGGEELVKNLLKKAVKEGLLAETATGFKVTKTSLGKRWEKRLSAPTIYEDYKEADSPQMWGDVAEYGGMPEWEGWSRAPLKSRDLVHVRLVRPVPLTKLRGRFPGWDVSESPEGTVVITGKPGDPVKQAVVEWLTKDNIAYESIRSATKVKRRNLKELPSSFLNDLLTRAVPLAYATILKKHRASMEILTGSQDDTKAWVSLWVTEFATMFDADKGRPFAAWAQIQIKHKVQDLNRAIHGRTASDLEIRWARAREHLENVLGRTPTQDELSQELNITEEELESKRSMLGQMKAIRSASPIDTGPDFADLPVIDHLADPESEAMRVEARQMVTLAMLNAAGRVDDVTGERILELPLGFISTYLMEWDDWVKSDLVYLSGCASSKINKELSLMKDSLKTQLEGLELEN